jgi:catechol 2,3-dioxygenase-like lactoylglutathione lyase family enzyme
MTPVQSMIAVTYVRDIDSARAFYELLGFREQSAGRAETSAWSALHQGDLSVLLAYTRPPLEIAPLPLMFYFFCHDLDAIVAGLGTAGVEVTRTGHPPHAPGGEVKVLDPDGNTILIGQAKPSASAGGTGEGGEGEEADAAVRFSLLKEAAAAVSAQGITVGCQVPAPGGTPCPDRAEVKLADSGGEVAWACLVHAEEILITVPAAFIASRGEPGLADFLSRRQQARNDAGPPGP